MVRKPRIRVTESSGNIFADLGFANPERERLKADLILQIYRLLKKTQARADPALSPRGRGRRAAREARHWRAG